MNIGIKDLKKVAQIAKQTKCKMKIIKKKGLPFLFNRYRKRKLFFVFLLVIIFGLGISSNFVWNIEVEGNEKISKEEIINELKEQGVLLEAGKRKGKIVIEYNNNDDLERILALIK